MKQKITKQKIIKPKITKPKITRLKKNQMISPELLEEIASLLSMPKQERLESKIFFDGRQYKILIPKKIAESAQIDAENDSVLFQLEHYAISENRKPGLKIILQRKDKHLLDIKN